MKIPECSFSDLEIKAIIAALPLLEYRFVDVDGTETSDEQFELNIVRSSFVENKLLHGVRPLLPEDLRIICAAVILAEAVLSCKVSFDLDPDLRKDISAYFFVYKSLLPKVDQIFSRLERAFHQK